MLDRVDLFFFVCVCFDRLERKEQEIKGKSTIRCSDTGRYQLF